MKTQSNKLDFTGQDIFVGIDAHLKNWKLAVMSEKLTHKIFSQPPNPDALHKFLVSNYPGATYHTAYEAGFCGFWIHNRLKELGVNSMVVNAADIPTTHKEKVQKEDKRDSVKIAKSLRSGDLKPIYVPSMKTVEDRALVRNRYSLVKDASRNKNRIKSFLHFHGIEIPEAYNNGWSKNFIKWLQSLEFTEPSAKHSLDAYISSVQFLKDSILKTTKHIREISRTDAYSEKVRLLISIPGIGLLTAMIILTEIEDIKRFKNGDQLCSYIGLIPSTGSSGEHEVIRNITPRGNKMLRKAIIESAWTAARRDPALTQSFYDYQRRMDSNKAIVKIAKKLLNRIRFVLINEKPYEFKITG